MLAAALLALSTQAAAAPAMPSGPGTVLRSELRDLPDEALVRRVWGPLAAFPFVSHRNPDRFSSFNRQISLWFWSRPRAADRAGTCVTDRMIVRFEGGLGLGGRDTAMQPRAFDLQPYFIIENPREARGPYSPEERNRYQLDEACSRLDPRRDSTPAESGYQLSRALDLIGALRTAAQEGRALAPLDCTRMNWNGDPPADEAACLRELSSLSEAEVGWVRSCPPQREAPGGCIEVLTNRWWVEFDLNSDQTPRRIVVSGLEDLSQAHLGPA